MTIEVKDLCFSYTKKELLHDINFTAESGELIALLGPNGVGKTTFFRCLLGFLKPQSGLVSVNGKDINLYSRKDLAKEIAYIPQSYSPAFNHTVLDSVLMGVTNQLGVFETPGEQFTKKALNILNQLGIDKLANQGSMKISGGERQLMLLARALIQDAHLLIMDEPTANLDFGNSFRVMEKLKVLQNSGYTIIFSTHDPSQAFHYASRVIAMKEGKIIADGKPDLLNEKVLKTLYGLEVSVCEKCKSVIIEP